MVFSGQHAPVQFIRIDPDPLCPEDGLFIFIHIFPDLVQDTDAFIRHMSGGLGSDIEQVVSAPAVDLDQKADDLFRILPVVVVLVEAPGIVQRRRNLPVAFIRKTGDEVVSCGHIFAQLIADPPADNTVRLEALHQIHHLLAFFLCRPHGGIEPDQGDVSILGQKLPKLREAFPFQVCAVILLGIVLSVDVPVRIVPVLRLGIIESQLHVILVAGFPELSHDIPAVRGGFYHIVIAALGIPHRKAFMMLGSKDDILHAPFLCLADDPLRVKFNRIKLGS